MASSASAAAQSRPRFHGLAHQQVHLLPTSLVLLFALLISAGPTSAAALPMQYKLLKSRQAQNMDSTKTAAVAGTIVGIFCVLLFFIVVSITWLRQRSRQRAAQHQRALGSSPAVRWVGAELYANETRDRVARARARSSNSRSRSNVGGSRVEMQVRNLTDWDKSLGEAPPPAYHEAVGSARSAAR